MLNVIVFQGRLTKDVELRQTTSGISVTTVTLACERDYKADGAEREVDFIDVTAWRGTAEFLAKYFQKGQMAIVEGRLQFRNWTDKNGQNRRSAEVVADHIYFAGSKREGSGSNSIPGNATYSTGNYEPMMDELDDETLPF